MDDHRSSAERRLCIMGLGTSLTQCLQNDAGTCWQFTCGWVAVIDFGNLQLTSRTAKCVDRGLVMLT